MKYFLNKSKKSIQSSKYITLVFVLFIGLVGFSQISFTEGYFIINDGERTECLIKNVDWHNNPVEFEYKITEGSETNTLTIAEVKEFGILGESKFVRANVQIDRLGNFNNPLVTKRESIFHEEELFLRVLVEGQASLYNYRDGNLNLFFFKAKDSDIKQLIFRRFIIDNKQITENNHFRQQLWNDLKCHEVLENNIAKIKYKKNDLVNFFVEYNQCINSEITWLEKNKKFKFHLTVRPGIQSSSLTADDVAFPNSKANFENQIGFRFGIEAEVVIPINKGKWAIIAEPTYQYYKAETEIEHPSSLIDTYPVEVDYKSIEFPVGARYYLFLNDNSKIFVNLLYVIDFTINNKTKYGGIYDFTLDSESGSNLAFGLGYKYSNYSFEMRYGFRRDLLENWKYWASDYKSLSFMFGYTLF